MTNEEMVHTMDVHITTELRGDLDGMVSSMSSDCFRYQPGFKFYIQGRPVNRKYYEAWFAAFKAPEGIPSVFGGRAYGDNAVVQWSDVSLQMRDSFLGIAATGKCARLPVITVFTFKDMLVESETSHYDTADFCGQLGLEHSAMKEALANLAREFAPAAVV